jgi:hypothetical protein
MVDGPTLPSAVRLTATARYLGVLVGPAVGGVIMLQLGPAHGIFLNAVFYVPLLLWMWKAPFGPRFRPASATPPRRAMRGVADIIQTARDIAHDKLIVSMTLLAGAASFFIGNSYQAQMPEFARDLGHGDPGVTYSMLLAADAAGALVAGMLLESRGLLRAGPRVAMGLAAMWCVALGGFAMAGSYPVALGLLFLAGACELSFNSMAQALVQMNAPTDIRGRVIGLFNMSALGLRAFAGLTVGVAGAFTGVHWSLAGAAVCMLIVLGLLRVRLSAVAVA